MDRTQHHRRGDRANQFSDAELTSLMASSVTASASKTRQLINVLGPFFGLLFVIGLFCLSSDVRPYFLTGANFKIILTQTVIVAIGALGMTMIIISGGIDLSVGSTVAFTSVVGATLLLKGFSPKAAIIVTMLAGGAIG